MIVGFFGFQRSGKTALATMFSRHLKKQYNHEIYTNIDTYKTTNEIEKITDIPVDYKSKTFLWDEIHFSMDSRKIKTNVDFTPFISTLGKQKILLLYTCPTPDLVDKRIRKFTSHYIMCKGDEQFIHFQFINALKNEKSKVYHIEKTERFFQGLNYNSDLVIPNMIESNITEYVDLVNSTLQSKP